MEIPDGYCQCGCGHPAPIAKKTDKRVGHQKGEPIKFIHGHHVRTLSMEEHPSWKGGRKITTRGYVLILTPGHPRADQHGYVYEHILVAEKAMGKPLPPGAMPHHVNEDKVDNRPGNLVVCQDDAYHQLLHQRKRAYEACGHANWRKCWICKRYDDPLNLYIQPPSSPYHQECKKQKR